MTTSPKKKRFEGLIQFKDSLRLTLVCLQASLREKFATSLQSPLVAHLDSEHDTKNHLLFSKNNAVGHIKMLDDLNDQHILCRIYQVKGIDLSTEIFWQSTPPASLSIWIDPRDSLSTSYVYSIISYLCEKDLPLDISSCHCWGSYKIAAYHKSQSASQAWLTQWKDELGLDEERVRLYARILRMGWKQFSNVTSIIITSDGTYISLTIEGKLKQCQNMQGFIIPLCQLPVHIVTVNYDTTDQIDFCIPIRMNKLAPLKGFIIVENTS